MKTLYRLTTSALLLLTAPLLSAQGQLLSLDFEADTPGGQPSGDWTISPTPNTATNGAVIVDASSTSANPLSGKGLYVYDLTGSVSTHVRQPLNGGVNVSAVRASFTFQRMYEASDADTRVHFTVGPAGLSLNSSDFRLFEFRAYNSGEMRVEYSTDGTGDSRGSTVVGNYDTSNPNEVVIFINSHSTETVVYDEGTLSGSLTPNMMDVYVNGGFVGSFLTLKTPDPVGAPGVDFWASDADLGQVAIYQDTSRQGGIVFDDINISEIEVGGGTGGSNEPVVFLDLLDFEDQVLGDKPVIPFPTVFSPGSNSATNGFVVVDSGTTPANPMDTGKAMYAFDLSGSAPTHMRFDFAPANTSNVRVDLDFQRMYDTPIEDEDTRIHIALAPAGLETNNSDFRPFEIRLLNSGNIVVNYNPTGVLEDGRESVIVGEYPTTGVNHLTFLANGNNSVALPYDDPQLGQGDVQPNTMVLFLNDVNLGEYLFINTPDPVNANQIAFYESTDDFGRLGIYQDTSRQGGIVIDNLSIREFAVLPPPAAPSGLTAQATGPDRISLEWTDNSEDETGFIIEWLDGDSWMEATSVEANVTTVEITGLDSETEYTFRVSSTNGSISEPSNEVSATTLAQLIPIIVMEPEGGSIPSGTSSTLTVAATGPAPLSFQWYTGLSGDTSNPVAGAEEASYTTPALTGPANYWVRVSNTNGSADSVTVALEVFEPRTIRIVSLAQLNALLPDAVPGDTYVLDNGTYPNSGIIFEGQGTQNAPITLKAETPGQVVLTGDSYLEVGGSWMVVEGLLFTNGWNQGRNYVIRYRTSNALATNCRVTNCAIIDFSPPDPATDRDWISMYGTDNTFDHNLISGHSNIGVTLVVWRNPGKEDRHRIAYNHFRDRANGGGQNGWETIRIGTSTDSLSSSKCIVEYNLFEACNGEIETISNKSGENIYRYNTFWKNQGMLTLRHGNMCLVEGNMFLGEGVSNTGGIRVIGEDHVVVNNYIERTMGRDGAAITVYAGVENSPLNEYYAAKNAVIAHNTIIDVAGTHISVGAGFGSSNRTVLPTGVVVDNNLLGKWATTSASFNGPALLGDGASITSYAGNIASGVAIGGTAATSGTTAVTVPWMTGSYGLLRPQAGSPVVDASVGSDMDLDMDGQARDSSPDVGADELVNTDGLNIGGPIQPLESGPAWRENIDTSPPWYGPALKQGRLLQSGKYGMFNIGDSDWIYHRVYGWMYVKPITTTDSMWYWSATRNGWLWSSRDCYPFFYDVQKGEWIYYAPSNGDGVYTYDSQQAAWVKVL
jgi:poly(beta-D-mannuronate) lyase